MQPASRAQTTARLALAAVLGSETVLFGSLFMVYLFMRANLEGGAFGQQAAADLVLPVLNTLVLLVSAGTAWWSFNAIRQGEVARLKTGLLVTLVLGLVFVGGQVLEFTQSGRRPDDAEFGGVFFTLMGFHAVHVLAGVIFLAINFARARLGDFSARRHVAVEVGTWFWAYVTGVWLVLFLGLYVI